MISINSEMASSPSPFLIASATQCLEWSSSICMLTFSVRLGLPKVAQGHRRNSGLLQSFFGRRALGLQSVLSGFAILLYLLYGDVSSGLWLALPTFSPHTRFLVSIHALRAEVKSYRSVCSSISIVSIRFTVLVFTYVPWILTHPVCCFVHSLIFKLGFSSKSHSSIVPSIKLSTTLYAGIRITPFIIILPASSAY